MADKLEVTMVRHISGTLNGDPWPDKGETTELDTGTAIHMVNAGHCTAVDEEAFAAAVEAAAPNEEASDEATTENGNEAGADGSAAEPAGPAEGDREAAKQPAPKAKPAAKS